MDRLYFPAYSCVMASFLGFLNIFGIRQEAVEARRDGGLMRWKLSAVAWSSHSLRGSVRDETSQKADHLQSSHATFRTFFTASLHHLQGATYLS
jgi:hypothetical protein